MPWTLLQVTDKLLALKVFLVGLALRVYPMSKGASCAAPEVCLTGEELLGTACRLVSGDVECASNPSELVGRFVEFERADGGIDISEGRRGPSGTATSPSEWHRAIRDSRKWRRSCSAATCSRDPALHRHRQQGDDLCAAGETNLRLSPSRLTSHGIPSERQEVHAAPGPGREAEFGMIHCEPKGEKARWRWWTMWRPSSP